MFFKAYKNRQEREQRQREHDLKQNIIRDRNLSLMIAETVSCLFDKNKRQITPLSEYYPGLFEQEHPQEMSLEAYTALFEDFAYRHNEHRKKIKGGEADGGR